MSVIPGSYAGTGKREKVAAMFNSIASRYDLLNHVLSGGIDKRWRKKVIELLSEQQPKVILDVATGTGDLALAAVPLHPEKIIGIDISEGMLAIGREKISKLNLSSLITLQFADSTELPFTDNSFDAVTVAFGVRNFEKLEKGLNEMLRVVRPGGQVIILEFSKPEKFPIKQLYNLYSRKIMPVIGQLLSRQRAAYEYLPESVQMFPYGSAFLKIMTDAGYSDTKAISLTFGIATIYAGKKSEGKN